jgi:hypothetical protein
MTATKEAPDYSTIAPTIDAPPPPLVGELPPVANTAETQIPAAPLALVSPLTATPDPSPIDERDASSAAGATAAAPAPAPGEPFLMIGGPKPPPAAAVHVPGCPNCGAGWPDYDPGFRDSCKACGVTEAQIVPMMPLPR